MWFDRHVRKYTRVVVVRLVEPLFPLTVFKQLIPPQKTKDGFMLLYTGQLNNRSFILFNGL